MIVDAAGWRVRATSEDIELACRVMGRLAQPTTVAMETRVLNTVRFHRGHACAMVLEGSTGVGQERVMHALCVYFFGDTARHRMDNHWEGMCVYVYVCVGAEPPCQPARAVPATTTQQPGQSTRRGTTHTQVRRFVSASPPRACVMNTLACLPGAAGGGRCINAPLYAVVLRVLATVTTRHTGLCVYLCSQVTRRCLYRAGKRADGVEGSHSSL